MEYRKILVKLLDWGMNLFLVFCGIVLLWLLVQIFCVTSFHIPSDSMTPELMAGDAILVGKMRYGARLFDVMGAIEGKRVKIRRMPGYGKVERNDVVVFNDPCPKKWRKMEMDVMRYYVKRCVALPGDTFRIVNGRYRVDGYPHDLGNTEAQTRLVELIEAGMIPAIKAYPGDSLTGWTLRDFGPFYLPKEGDSIQLDRHAYLLYRDAIEWEQQQPLTYKDDGVYMNDRRMAGYRFRKNYYFMAGDRVENSRDSRYWGMLPEEYIVGKAWKIWKSKDDLSGKIRWNRIWKTIE